MQEEKTLHRQERYQIIVEGTLDSKWRDWFDGFEIFPLANDRTQLTGDVADQAALHGLLAKIRDLCLPIISIVRLDVEEVENSADS